MKPTSITNSLGMTRRLPQFAESTEPNTGIWATLNYTLGVHLGQVKFP